MIEKVTEQTTKSFNRADHLANERTFLAWIRTNLGIMAFGFVVEKFSFFIQEIAAFLGKSGLPESRSTHSTLQGYSSIFGISLVGIGATLCIFVFLKFKKTEREINNNTYQSTTLLDALLALFVFFIGVFLMVYLINSHASALHN
jgi:putative membrane protein